jgi:putative flippase GtrA
MARINQKEKERFIKFALVGISGTLIDVGLFNLFNQYFSIPANYAKAYSFSLAVFNNFLWNRLWTFPESKTLPFAKQFSQYLLVSVIGLIINLIIFATFDPRLIKTFDEVLPADFILSSTVVGHNVSVAIATIVVLFWNYFANRFWTFKNVK